MNKDAAAVVEQLYEQVRQTDDPQLMIVTAELALLEARKLQRRDTDAAVSMNLMATVPIITVFGLSVILCP